MEYKLKEIEKQNQLTQKTYEEQKNLITNLKTENQKILQNNMTLGEKLFFKEDKLKNVLKENE